jgi:hypothetical protein
VIDQLEKAQGDQILAPEECSLIRKLKLRILGLSAIERCRAGKNQGSLGYERVIQTLNTFSLWPISGSNHNFSHELHKADTIV